MQQLLNSIILGSTEKVLATFDSNSVNMVITSPPYADRRKSTYGGIHESKYVDWFIPIAFEIKRILKPTGSFFLNIKPHTHKGERSLYVNDLISALKRTCDLKYIDELCWTKNAFPGELKGRFKNAFEPIYHFAKSGPEQLTFNPTACGTPIKAESIARTYRKQCGSPKNGSGMTGMNTTNIRQLQTGRPSNVIAINNVSNQFSAKKEHPATYPEALVEFFIKSFTNEGDLVLDPFSGSGTTGLACKKLNRNYILIDKQEQYVQLMRKRLMDPETYELLY